MRRVMDKTIVGYDVDDVIRMIDNLNIAYEIIDGAPEVDKAISDTIGLLAGLVREKYV